MKPSMLLSLSCLLLALFPVPSLAQPALELVVLKDGSAYQGELVEKVLGDHVTIKLATGEIKRFTWAQLKPDHPPSEIGEASPEGPPPPLPPAPPPESGPPESGPPQPAGRYVAWPEPPRAPGRLDGQRVFVGLGVAWDFPFSIPVDVVVGYEPVSWFGAELTGTYGNPFGPSLGEMVRFGLPLYDAARIGVGVGARQNFLIRGGGDRFLYPGAPHTAQFLDFELFGDTFFGRYVVLRTIAGFGDLLNGSSYTSMCSGSFFDDCALWGPAGDPWAAAQGQRIYGYVKVQLIWHFHL